MPDNLSKMPDTEQAVPDSQLKMPDTKEAVPDTTHTHFALSHLLRVLFVYKNPAIVAGLKRA